MNDELILQEPVQLTPEDVVEFDDVDEVINRSLVIGDPLMALEYGKFLSRARLVKGIATAKLLWKLQENWEFFSSAGIGDTFENVVESYMGYNPQTTTKYVRLWGAIFENPGVDAETKRMLMGKPISQLILLTAAARTGELDDEGLRAAAESPDKASLKDIIVKARGRHTSSSSAIRICVNFREDSSFPQGTVYAIRGDERVDIGMLYLDLDDEIAKKAINSLIQNSHMIEVH